MKNTSLEEKIENYLSGKSTPQEKAEMEAEMATDPELVVEVEKHRVYLYALNRLAVLDMKEKIKRWNAEATLEHDKPTLVVQSKPRFLSIFDSLSLASIFSSQNVWRTAGIAAVGLLLIVAAIRHFVPPTKQQNAPQTVVAEPTLNNIQDLGNPNQGNVTGETHVEKPIKSETIATHRPVKKQLPPQYKKASMPQNDIAYAALSTQQRKIADRFYNETAPRSFKGELMGRNNGLSENSEIARIAKEMDDGNLNTAEKLLNEFEPTENFVYEKIKLAAHLYFKKENFKQAIQKQKALQARKFETDYADWYLLLAYLATYPDHQSDFNQLLEGILSSEGHTFRQKADALKRQLTE
jgi:hypothetical protein